jgi:hypothetical protein
MCCITQADFRTWVVADSMFGAPAHPRAGQDDRCASMPPYTASLLPESKVE